MRRSLALAAAMMAIAGSAAAAPDDIWTLFPEASAGGYVSDQADWEVILYDAAQAQTTQSRAVAVFAQALDLDDATATRYTDLIVMSAITHSCQESGGRLDWFSAPVPTDLSMDADDWLADRAADAAADAAAAADLAAILAAGADEPGRRWDDFADASAIHPACAALDPDALAARMIDAGLAEPTGRLLAVIVRNGDGWIPARAGIEAALAHPQATVVLQSQMGWDGSDLWALALVARTPGGVGTAELVERMSSQGVRSGPAAGWMEALLEVGLAHATDADARIAYDRALLDRELQYGMAEAAAGRFGAASDADREHILTPGRDCEAVDCDAIEWRILNLAAALELVGDHEGALALLDRLAPDPRPGALRNSLSEALRPRLEDAALFEPFVLGDEASEDDDYSSFEGRGWLFALRDPLPRRVVARRLGDAGYDDLAAALNTPPGDHHSLMDDDLAMLQALGERLGPEAETHRDAWRARLDALPRSQRDGRAWGSRPLASWWTERRLTEAERSPPEPDRDDDVEPGFDLPEGVPGHAILRAETNHGEHAILFRSSEYDLPGEIPAFGLWLVRTQNGVWREPVYLGLQTHFPYVPTRRSRLPLIRDGRLTIEVQLREIDPASIFFPPVALGFLRQEDGLAIEATLADIERDSDGDGLTDIAETQLGLDPTRADSDGDGTPDGRDPLPGVAYDPLANPARTALVLAILERLVGHDAGAIVIGAGATGGDPLAAAAGPPSPGRFHTLFMVGEPRDYAALSTPFRLIVRTPEDVAAANNGGPPFFPPEVTVYSSLDDRIHFVSWSASWVGGAFVVRCTDLGAACEVETLSEWIT